MELNSIEKLLEKYDMAETTLQEEAQLHAYFASDNVAPHLEYYKPMFQYFSETQNDTFTKEVAIPMSARKKSKSKLYQWISVAAAAVLMLGIVIPQFVNKEPKTLANYSVEEQEMYLKTKEALALLSANFNRGTSSINVLDMASENLNAGMYKASFVSQFGKTTNQFIK